MAAMVGCAYHLEQICNDNTATPPTSKKVDFRASYGTLKKACLTRSDVVYRRNNFKVRMAKGVEKDGDEDGGLISPCRCAARLRIKKYSHAT